jgi:predicted unusual protein kinase regulating ubiquinone biosynthesis (AarF/ABC1/UbiB family)
MSQEQSPDQARLERIEKALETLGGIVTDIGLAQRNTEHALTEAVQAAERDRLIMSEDMRKLAAAQTRTEGHMDQLAVKMDQLAVKSTETQEKLNALIHMWDEMIREGRAGKNGTPKPEPPPAA